MIRDRFGMCVVRVAAQKRQIVGDQPIAADGAVGAGNAEAGGGVALRVEVDQQDLFVVGGQRGGQVDRGRGLADPSLLVGDRQDAHAWPGGRRFDEEGIRLWE